MSYNDLNDDENNALAKFEQEIVNGLVPEAEDPVLDQQADALGADGEQTGPAPSPAAPPAPAAPTPTAAPAGQAGGDPRAALRASRASERRAREENERLRAELEELRSKQPAAREEDSDMSRLETDLPEVARVLKKIVQRVDATAAPAAPKQEAEAPAFVPDSLPAELQVAVDGIDQLSDWQHDPDQTAWRLAKSTDGMLSQHPAWKDKPLADRLAEVARRVGTELGSKATGLSADAAAAARVIDRTGSRPIETLSDLRSGASPASTTGPDYSQMTPDEITAALDRLGRG